ncbi:MAG: dTDP-4-dehydrorhamnose reductase, partial [Bdellovibrionia bacterium]
QGQLGRAFQELLGSKSGVFASRHEANLSDPDATIRYLDSIQPSLILNAAAYTAVDRAEHEPELARLVNAETPGRIAQWCSKKDVPLVHFSTDYVFSGKGSSPWKETSPISPLNVYGRTKAEGEKNIVEAGGRHLIFRTSWVYDTQGKNFLRTILKLAQEREILRIVDDQFGVPTLASDLARGAWEVLHKTLAAESFTSGFYHLCNQGETTWYEFAKAIIEEATHQRIYFKLKKIVPISSAEFPTPAIRPHNSRLDTSKAYNNLNVRLPDWRASLNCSIAKGLPRDLLRESPSASKELQ